MLRKKGTERAFTGNYVHTTTTASTAAPAAARSCSTPTPSSTRAPAGRASPSRRWPRRSSCSATSPRHDPHRGHLPALRRPPRPRVRRRPARRRAALLHQLLRARARRRSEAVTAPLTGGRADRPPPFSVPRAPQSGALRTKNRSAAPATRSRVPRSDAMRHPQHEEPQPHPGTPFSVTRGPPTGTHSTKNRHDRYPRE